MSVKIFNGFRVFKKDNQKIENTIKQIEEQANIVLKEYLYKLFISYAVHCIDQYIFFKNDFDLHGREFKNKNIETLNQIFENHIDLEMSTDEIENYNIFIKNQKIIDSFSGLFEIISRHTSGRFYKRIHDFDTTFYISVYYNKDRDNYFFIPNFEQENLYLPIIKNQKIFKNYNFWDHTDGDERIKNRLWNKRGENWYPLIYKDEPFKNYTIIHPIKIILFYQEFLKDLKNKNLEIKYIEYFENLQKSKIKKYAKEKSINQFLSVKIKSFTHKSMIENIDKFYLCDNNHQCILNLKPARILTEISNLRDENRKGCYKNQNDIELFYNWVHLEMNRTQGYHSFYREYILAKTLLKENDPEMLSWYDENLNETSQILSNHSNLYDYLNIIVD